MGLINPRAKHSVARYEAFRVLDGTGKEGKGNSHTPGIHLDRGNGMMSIDEFGGNPLRYLPPTSSIRQKKIEQNGKKQHKKTAIALVDLGPKTGANGNLRG